MKLKIGFYEDNKFVTDDYYDFEVAEEFALEIENKKGLDNRNFYQWFISCEEFVNWSKDNFSDKTIGLIKIGDRDYSVLWFFRPNYDKHIDFFTKYYDIFYDEEWMNEVDLETEIYTYLNPQIDTMKIDLSKQEQDIE
jgi:hypothetical protein